MKLVILVIALLFAFSCNNGHHSADPAENNSSVARSQSDSLYKAVMEGHELSMAKMGEIVKYQKIIKQRTDSLAGLKAKNASLQAGLDSAWRSLNEAEELMNKWMQDFDPDKAGNTEKDKAAFYSKEKAKIDTVNARISSSIEGAKKLVN